MMLGEIYMLDRKSWQVIFERAQKYFTNPLHLSDKSIIIDICTNLNQEEILELFKEIINKRKDNITFPPPEYFRQLVKKKAVLKKDCGLCEQGYIVSRPRSLNIEELELNSYTIEFICNCDMGLVYKKLNPEKKLPKWNNEDSKMLLRRMESLKKNLPDKLDQQRFIKNYYLKDLTINSDLEVKNKNISAKHIRFYLKNLDI